MKFRKIEEKYILCAETKDEKEIVLKLIDLGYCEEFRRCIKTELEHGCEGAKNLITLLKYITDVFIKANNEYFEEIYHTLSDYSPSTIFDCMDAVFKVQFLTVLDELTDNQI